MMVMMMLVTWVSGQSKLPIVSFVLHEIIMSSTSRFGRRLPEYNVLQTS